MFTLQCKANTSGGSQATVFGINIASLAAGLRYHSIGINGAQYQNYNNTPLFASQIAHLKPDLIIIGLGTNEAQSRIGKDVFKSQITQFVNTLQQQTFAPILLYTPADSYLNGTSNPNLITAAEAIQEVCMEQNVPLWDLYHITGGNRSALQWRTCDLLTREGVHYTKKGYRAQAELLYEALQNLVK